MKLHRLVAALPILLAANGFAQNALVNWENPHVHPLAISPDGGRLFAVNTPDNRLEVFDLASGVPAPEFEVFVGVDPVSVRARTNGEVWVVNHISDSVSVVDLATRNVVATLETDDEPADVVFAGTPQRAFVSCSQANTVLVFDPANLSAPPVRLAIDGQDPRALAVSSDGTRVFVAIFESGNRTTVLGGGISGATPVTFPPNVVNDMSGPYGGMNPPPNFGALFDPPQDPGNGTPPAVSLIVRKNAAGQWMDDNNSNWTPFVSGASAHLSGRLVGWDLADNDVAIIDASSLTVGYVKNLMNICMALAVNPANGEVTVVGTDATNEIRFEPVVNGRFLRVNLARVDAAGPATLGIKDLNGHLDYSSSAVIQAERDKSIGDPRGIVWNSTGTRAYVTGMGSNNVVVLDAAGNRAGIAPAIEVGEGPTGIVIDEARGQLYVQGKFAGAVSVVDLATELEVARVPYFDPSPPAIKVGRKHLYDTHKTSGLGHVACASCHVDARLDHLAWDLGDPMGAIKAVTGQNLGFGFPGLGVGFQPFHPMKGPMTTQTLQDIIGKEPLHWRGDRDGLEEFNGAFVGLQGDDTVLSVTEMQQYEDFLATIAYPPNPFRNLDNSLPADLPLPGHYTTGRFAPPGQPLPNGDAVRGLQLYRPPNLLDAGALACITCHTLPTGMGTDTRRQGGVYVPLAAGPNGERHHALVSQDGTTNVSTKIPQLRNVYEKVGFNTTQLVNHFGVGFLHDGSVDSIERFIAEPVFNVQSDQDVADLVAFMLAFSGSDLPSGAATTLFEPPGTPSQDSHAAVGTQTTLVSLANPAPQQLRLILIMLRLAEADAVGLVARGLSAGVPRGYVYLGKNVFQSDRSAETLTAAQLAGLASPGAELTLTLVPKGSEVRIGVDRDSDGVFDRDELDFGADPADPLSVPGGAGVPFCFGDGRGSACPCGNESPVGGASGCLNSTGLGGKLTASGVPSLAGDTLVLAGSQMTNSLCVYFQGTLRENESSGSPLGDGLLCASGAIVRLGATTNAGGASSFPLGGQPGIASQGGVLAPGTRTYQVTYRNSAPFCTSATSNYTNGWSVFWIP